MLELIYIFVRIHNQFQNFQLKEKLYFDKI